MDMRIALSGIGGYGEGYVAELLSASEKHEVKLIAGIEPYPEHCRNLDELKQAGIPIYPSLDAFFNTEHADLMVISSPIHLHATQTCFSLVHKSNVLCEKPLCAVIQDALWMAETQQKTGLIVGIGYQWSFSAAIQALKQDIMKGIFGRPKRLKTLILWPRLASYYKRNSWAGRIKSDDDKWVLDSPANNAMAHYLHNALYVLGDIPQASAQPVSVQAELYRANPIENYDTAFLRVMTERDVEILFYGSHAVPENINPTFCFEFEQATVEFPANNGENIIAQFKDGSVRKYGNPNTPGEEWKKLWQTIEAIRTGKPVLCGIEAATAQTVCINGAQGSTEVISIPQEYIRRDRSGEADSLTWVEGLPEAIQKSYSQGCLPSEMKAYPWSKAGKPVDLGKYTP